MKEQSLAPTTHTPSLRPTRLSVVEAVYEELFPELLVLASHGPVRAFRSEVTRQLERRSSKPVMTCRTLAEILEDPTTLLPPDPVIPRVAWGGRLTLLAGREKDGKSTFATAAAAAVSQGEIFLGERCPMGVVLWVMVEEHPNDLAQRAVRHRTRDDGLFVLEFPADPLTDLEAAVRSIRPVLVVVDTLYTFVCNQVRDPNSPAEWAIVLSRLTRLARESSAAFLLLHHARKSDGHYRDSTAIGAGVDVILEMDRGEDENTRRFKAQGRWGIANFAVRLAADGYDLVAGKLTLDMRIYHYVDQHPGSSLVAVREGVGGKATEVDDALYRLIARKAIVDDGDERQHAYRACPKSEAEAASETPGPVPRNSLSRKGGPGSGTGGQSQTRTPDGAPGTSRP